MLECRKVAQLIMIVLNSFKISRYLHAKLDIPSPRKFNLPLSKSNLNVEFDKEILRVGTLVGTGRWTWKVKNHFKFVYGKVISKDWTTIA